LTSLLCLPDLDRWFQISYAPYLIGYLTYQFTILPPFFLQYLPFLRIAAESKRKPISSFWSVPLQIYELFCTTDLQNHIIDGFSKPYFTLTNSILLVSMIFSFIHGEIMLLGMNFQLLLTILSKCTLIYSYSFLFCIRERFQFSKNFSQLSFLTFICDFNLYWLF
jgi:hypothetical protein